jgi:hypothetical protein
MLDAGYFLKRAKVGETFNSNGIPWETFSAREKRKVIEILENLWGRQFDVMTLDRIGLALTKGSFPPGTFDELDEITAQWIRVEFMPVIRNSMLLAGNGSRDLVGIMDRINVAVGADILFDLDTEPMRDYIRKVGADLAVDLTDQQHLSQSITLTNRETQALINFEERTLDRWTKFYRNKFPHLSESEILERARATTRRKVKVEFGKVKRRRADRIARTELKRAKHEAEEASHLQAIDKKVISAAWKTWRRNNRTDNWMSSEMYDGKRIPIKGSFSQFGTPPPKRTTMLHFRHPGEINEECSLDYESRR